MSTRNVQIAAVSLVIAAASLVIALSHRRRWTGASNGRITDKPIEGAHESDTVESIVGRNALELACNSALLRATIYARLSKINLSGLDLSGSGVLPSGPSLAKLTSVVFMDLSNNRLESVDGVECMESLVELNVSKNRLAALPAAIGRLARLKVLNAMANLLDALPDSIGDLSALERLGLKTNLLVSLPDTIGGLESLVELYLTDNKLMALPPSLGRCRRLRKLQASFNDLRALPKEMGDLEELELFRAAVNPNLTYVPAELTTMARLSWLSLAGCAWCPERPPHAGLEELKPAEVDVGGGGAVGNNGGGGRNPAAAAAEVASADAPAVPTAAQADAAAIAAAVPTPAGAQSGAGGSCGYTVRFADGGTCGGGGVNCGGKGSGGADDDDASGRCGGCGLSPLPPGEILGEGASGDVVAGVWRGRPVAVKTFKSAASPDGRAADELAVACFVDHPRLARAVGVVRRPELSLVMERIPGKPLALKPNFASVLRCRWPEGARFRSRFVLSVGMQVARALEYLHARGVCHGDVYAHNILSDPEGRNVVLVDFGASFFYPTGAPELCGGENNIGGGNGGNGWEDGAAAGGGGACRSTSGGGASSRSRSWSGNSASGGGGGGGGGGSGSAPPPPGLGLRLNFEAVEVRAFGLLMRDLAARARGLDWVEQDLVGRCCAPDAGGRPTFTEIANQLEAELLQMYPQTPEADSKASGHTHFFGA